MPLLLPHVVLVIVLAAVLVIALIWCIKGQPAGGDSMAELAKEE